MGFREDYRRSRGLPVEQPKRNHLPRYEPHSGRHEAADVTPLPFEAPAPPRNWALHEGHSLDLIQTWPHELDLVVTDPPYAFGGSGTEHAVSATVATVLRETAARLRRGSWMVVLCASSHRSVSYMIEACRGLAEPVRYGFWCKPESRTKVRTPGWGWASVIAVAMRRGAKNRKDLPEPSQLDWVSAPVVTKGRRAQLPVSVADWAVAPFAVPGGTFLDPFAGSGMLPMAAARAGMVAHGFELNPPDGAA